MIDMIIAFVVIFVVSTAIRYMRKEKHGGCIGCPCAGSCAKKDCGTAKEFSEK